MDIPYNSTKSFSEEQMIDIMRHVMNGHYEDDIISNLLTTIKKRGETVEEITGAARVLREKANMIFAPLEAVDCCGTGGDGLGTYNISTAVGLVSASCGVPVAKHGNRASSSKSGAADVLEALGVSLELPPHDLEVALEQFGFCFLMAPYHHQAMKHVAPIRKKLGFRTIFNILGPLANPAGAKYQLIGVYDKKLVRPIAEVLKNLGSVSAWVVHGADGLDEITVTDETYVAILKHGNILEKVITPEDFGIAKYPMKDLIGGDAHQNAKALLEILNGMRNAYRDIVLCNTAAVLFLAGRIDNLKDGVAMAAEAIDSGKALQTLEQYKIFSKEKNDQKK